MTDYFPEQTLAWFKEDLIEYHKSTSYVPSASRGIRLVGANEVVKPSYVYIGTGEDVAVCLRNLDALDEPICVISAGKCSAMKDGSVPDDVYLICIDLPLATLYNRIREFLHHYRIIESPTESIHINKHLKSLIEDIIELRITDNRDIQSKLIEAKISLGHTFRLMVITFGDTSNPSAVAWNFIITILEEMHPNAYVSMYGNNLLLLERNASMDEEYKPSETMLKFLEQYNAYLGQGNVGYHFSSLPAMYSQALAGIKFGTAIDTENRFCPYEKYAMYQVVEFALDSCGRLMKSRNPIHLCNIEAVTLMRYDNENNDNLLEVLHAYLKYNCNISETARALFIHRNTMNNKLHKIEEVICKKLDDPDLLERLRFSCIVLDYQKKFVTPMNIL